jgi:hypothetical protein
VYLAPTLTSISENNIPRLISYFRLPQVLPRQLTLLRFQSYIVWSASLLLLGCCSTVLLLLAGSIKRTTLAGLHLLFTSPYWEGTRPHRTKQFLSPLHPIFNERLCAVSGAHQRPRRFPKSSYIYHQRLSGHRPSSTLPDARSLQKGFNLPSYTHLPFADIDGR